MLGNQTLIAFVAVTDGTAARTFYEGAVGLEVVSEDARAIWTAPSGARIAWFKDPFGNTLSLST